MKDDSGNIIIQEGDSAFVWKDGKKLPVFDFSSNSEGDDDDIGSSGSEITSGSSRIRSSAAGYDADEYIDEYGPTSGGSGSGSGEVNHDRSSNSNGGSGVSSSIDLSFLSSSSSAKILSSTTVSHDDKSSSSKRSSSSVDTSVLSSSSSSLGVASSTTINNGDDSSSSSKKVIGQSSVSQSSSSVTEYVLSSSSTGTHGGGGGTEATCGAGTVSGTCVASPSPGFRNEVVTYTFTPDAKHTCAAFDEVKWYVNEYLEEGAYHPTTGEPLAYWVDPSSSSRASFSFDVKYSSIGDKKSVIFSMGGQNKQCDAVTIKRACESNTYTCTRRLVSATNNLWKNDVKYEWTFSYSGCLEGVSYTWQGALSGSTGTTVTKTYSGTDPINQSVSLSIVDELHGLNGVGSPITKSCDPAYAIYDPDLPPTCAVDDLMMPVDYTFAVTPTTVTGCSYTDGNKCKYSLEDEGGVVVASASSGYTGGALSSFKGPSAEGTVGYTLTLTNYLNDPKSCTFNITYVVPESVPFTYGTSETFESGKLYAITYSKTGSALVCPTNSPSFECNGTTYPTNQYSQTSISNPSSNCTMLKVLGSGTMSCQFTW